MRNRFARADNVIAVADSDEFADRNNAAHDFGTTTVTVEFGGSGEQRRTESRKRFLTGVERNVA